MFLFNMSVDEKNANWFRAIEKSFTIKMKAIDGVVASKAGKRRTEISVACESQQKSAAQKVIRDSLMELYLTVCKYDYLQKALHLPNLSQEHYKILLHTLVAFDREAETEIVDKHLVVGDYLALDGFFYFRLAELRGRWDEIVRLASGNTLYLGNEDTLNELIKFLMSAVSPRIQKLSVRPCGDSYSVYGQYQNSMFEYRTGSSEQLLIYLIHIAPLELVLEGDFSDERLYRRIVSIFDGKSAKV